MSLRSLVSESKKVIKDQYFFFKRTQDRGQFKGAPPSQGQDNFGFKKNNEYNWSDHINSIVFIMITNS